MQNAVRENDLLYLREQIEQECTYIDVVAVYNEYLDDNQYEGRFYPMLDFENVYGDSFKELFHRVAIDFSFDSAGFWIQSKKIHSGNIHKYYDEVVKYDIDAFIEWVYDNDYQEKLGLEAE